MPALARKILIIAAIDGLLLTPIPNPRARSPPTSPPGSVKIEYKTQKISAHIGAEKRLHHDTDAHSGGVEAHGIAGLLKVSSSDSFLIAITDREQVASIRGKHPVYVITNIALIPLSSRKEALAAIENAHDGKRPVSTDGSASDTEGEIEADEEDSNAIVDDDIQEEVTEAGKAAAAEAKHIRSNSSIGEDVIGRKGAYGRFAEKWFSKRGWTVDRRRAEGMSAEPSDRPSTPSSIAEIIPNNERQKRPENKLAPPDIADGIVAGKQDVGGNDDKDKGPAEEKAEEKLETVKGKGKGGVSHSLTPKLLHTTKLLLASSRSFYFSYDYDITRSWSTQVNNPSGFSLFKIVDPMYFWNRHLQKQFIDSGQEGLVLPLMQGFVGQRTFSAMASSPSTPENEHDDDDPVESEDKHKANDFLPKNTATSGDTNNEKFILTLISRRSTRRAGLRYLRRGVDDHGHVANSVETEQLLSNPSWDHVFSYLQIRGSIPLYFSQSPYSLRPRPVLLLSDESNATAIRTHFKNLRERYGEIQVINLVEADGNEAVVGNKYRDAVAAIKRDSPSTAQVGWTWFDFHKECRGMRFENVSRLFTDLASVLDDFSYTESTSSGTGTAQRGVLRTNCMDCLDRTNVVQSGAARRTLEVQLSSLGVTLASETWFNTLWADNGDAISKQYASTAALKGDFTRTRRRNLGGALTDFSLTITRYFTNIISDFFTQAAIDFLLGSVTAQVFSDFEAEMASGDPAVSLRRLRQNAIETSSKIVVADEAEELLGGWTFLSPRSHDSLRGDMAEQVLLLTDKALYSCGFDWALEKVSAYERVPLESVVGVRWGTYITSTLAASHVDEERNVGLVLRYRSGDGDEDIVRVNTRSLRNTFSKKAGKKAMADLAKDNVSITGEEADDNNSTRPTPSRTDTKFWAFKAMPAASTASIDVDVSDTPSTSEIASMTEREAVRNVVSEIKAACERYGRGVSVGEDEIVGLAEAKKETGLVEQWAYSIKKLVWA